MGDPATVWLQDWQRPRVRRRFDLRTGHCLESKVLETDKPGPCYFGVCSRCCGGFALVYRTAEGIWLQLGSRRFRMNDREALFDHEKKLGGLLSELRIEARGGESPPLIAKRVSLRNVLSPALDAPFKDDFFHWVANSANDVTWVSWVSQQWKPVDAEGAANASG